MRSPVRAPVKSRGRVSEKSAFAVAPERRSLRRVLGVVVAFEHIAVSERSLRPRRSDTSWRCHSGSPRAPSRTARGPPRRAPRSPPRAAAGLGHHPRTGSRPGRTPARAARGGQLRRHLLLEVRNDRLGGVEQLRVVRLVAGQRERHLGDRLVRVLRQPGAPLSLGNGGGAAAARPAPPPPPPRARRCLNLLGRVFASSAARLRAASSFLSASLARGDAPGTPFADLFLNARVRRRRCAEPLGVGGGGGGGVGGARRLAAIAASAAGGPRASARPPAQGWTRRPGPTGKGGGSIAGAVLSAVPSPLLSRVPKAETERTLLLEGLLEGPPPPGGRRRPASPAEGRRAASSETSSCTITSSRRFHPSSRL